MNFDVLPEVHWRYGYPLFWATVACVVGSLLLLMRRNRLL
jgi:magnesium transporter